MNANIAKDATWKQNHQVLYMIKYEFNTSFARFDSWRLKIQRSKINP